MAKAVWNDVVLAESEDTVMVEGPHYIPSEAVNWDYFEKSETHTTCPWKGVASYYTVEVDGQKNRDAAWYYPQPSGAVAQIKDHVAFWRGVQIF